MTEDNTLIAICMAEAIYRKHTYLICIKMYTCMRTFKQNAIWLRYLASWGPHV